MKDIRDITLAPSGHQKIDWVRRNMPLLRGLEDEFTREKPFAGLRVARYAPDSFSRLLSSAITVWIVAQAVVNIGAVIGVFPITGVPLPLVSQGLSSVLVTMVGLGMLMSFARREPAASQALAARATSRGALTLSWLHQGTRRGPLGDRRPRHRPRAG